MDLFKLSPSSQTFKIAENDVLGRHLIAARDIEPGEIVLHEKPLVIGPSQITEPVCLGCLRSLQLEDSEECPKCGWPVCSSECASAVNHKPECEWTTKKRGQKVKISYFVTPHPSYECITALRCLHTKTASPKIWSKLQALESHCEFRKATPKYEADKRSVAGFLRRFFKADKDFSEDEILRICGIIQVNGHENPLTTPSSVAVYEKASLLEHSCLPNCGKGFTDGDGLIIKAVKRIPEGANISICYTDSMWGTLMRRHHLLETKFFLCQCVRCADPTELGSYFSGLTCPNRECDFFVLPTANITDPSVPVDWLCSKCESSRSNVNVQSILRRISTDLVAMDKNDEASCKLFLDHYSKSNLLHPNHYLLTEIRLALAQLYGQKSKDGIQEISDSELEHKTELCKQVLQLANHLLIAEWRVRGTLLFELHAAVAERTRRDAATGLLSHGTLIARLLESKCYLEESLDLLQHEPDILPEGKIAVQAEINLNELNTLLQKIRHAMGECPI